jgi:tight adherence protein C
MQTFLRSIYLVVFCLLSIFSATGQTVCPSDYSRITSACIKNEKLKFNGKPIKLVGGMENNIYFYKTSDGGLGKLKIIGSVINPLECTLLIDAVTFNSEKNFVPNSSVSISVQNNHWLKNRIFLDREGFSALELSRTNNRSDDNPNNDNNPDACVLMLTKGAEISFYKKDVEKIREENLLLFYTPLVLVFIAIFLVVRLFMEEQEKFKTSEALEDAENTNKNKTQPFFLKVTKPFYKRYFLPIVQGFKNKQAIKTKYRQKIANAGMLKEITPEEFMALKIFMILGGPFVFLTVRWILEETWPLTITPIMGVLGYFYPNIWLNGLIAKRGTTILQAMPFIVDMLALSVEAGLDFMAAIQRVIEKAPPSPLVEEFETLIKETKIGSSRAEGLRQMGWRINIIEINSFCATLIAADSVGASIAPILKQLSNELRVKRSSRAEQLGATAATKILIPMIFFVLPAVLVAIFAPMILKMMSGKL